RRARRAHRAGVPPARVPPAPRRGHRLALRAARPRLRARRRPRLERDRRAARARAPQDRRRAHRDGARARLPAARAAVTRRPSLARRLLASSLLGLAVLLPAGGVALSFGFRRAVEAAFDERLDAWSHAIVAALAARDADRAGAARLGDPRFDRPLSGWYWEARAGGE